MRATHVFSLFLMSVIVNSFCYAQSVEGQVIDVANAEPLPGANLYFKKNPGLGTTTSLNGKYVLAMENTIATDTVIISFIGYKRVALPLSVLRQKPTIKLTADSQEIKGVVIKAQRLISEEFNVKKISRIEIYKNPSANADPLLAVNSLPSATTTDESANVSFRGSSANETGIFFNDVPIYDAVRFAGLNGIGTFSIFNTSIVKDVVVFPGNPPLEYGNTTSGVISIYTYDKIPKENQNSAVVSLASLGFNRYQKISEKSGLTLFTNYSPSAAIRSLNGEALRNISKFRSNDIGLHFVHQFDQTTMLNIFNYAISEGYTFNFRSPTYDGDFNQKRKRNFTVINLKKTFSKSSLALNGGYSLSQQNFDYSLTNIDIRNRDYFLGVNYQYYGKSSDLKVGVSLDNRKEKFSGSVPEFNYAIGLEHPVIDLDTDNDVAVPEVYAYYKYNFSDKWTAGIGGRKNIFQSEVNSYWSYQANLHFKPSKYLQFILGAGQYHRQPLNLSAATEPLLRSRQVSLDIKYKRNRIEQSLSFFYKKNQLNTVAEVSGVEYYTETKIDAKTKIQLSVSAISAKATTDELTYSTQFDISPFIKGSISRDFPYGISATTNFLWRQGVPFRPTIGARFDANLNAYEPELSALNEQDRRGNYTNINLAVNKLHAINEKLTIIYFASINNIFDFENERSRIYNFDFSSSTPEYFSRRSVYFGASINF